MSAFSPSTPSLAQVPALQLRRFTVDEYDRMVQFGILDESAPVELLEGFIVLKEKARPAPEVLVLERPTDAASPYPPLPIYQFSLDDYHHLLAAGILREGEPVELLEGWIVTKMTRNPPHDVALSLAEHEIDRRLPSEWCRRGQSAVSLPPDNEPEPDLTVVRAPRRRYRNSHPVARDLGLVLEVAESTLAHDRAFKGRIYARAGIPFYWILNLPDGRLEVYSDPSGPTAAPQYRQRRDYGKDETVPLILDGREVGQIPVQDLLPWQPKLYPLVSGGRIRYDAPQPVRGSAVPGSSEDASHATATLWSIRCSSRLHSGLDSVPFTGR